MTEANISIAAAFLAGVISVLSPCVIPVLPTYTAYLAGSAANRGEIIRNAVCFFCGFTVVFMLMGATASLLSQLFLKYQQIIRQVGAIFMIIMGSQLAGIISLPLLGREYRPWLNNGPKNYNGAVKAVLLGMAFTAGWTPCVGPVLATILIYAGSTASLNTSLALLLAYAAGFAIPFLLLTLLLSRSLGRLKSFYHLLPFIQKAAGCSIIIIGLLLYFDLLTKFIGKVS